MTNVPLSARRVSAGPPGIEIGTSFYDLQKSDGWTITRLVKNHRKSRRKNKALQASTARRSAAAPVETMSRRAARFTTMALTTAA
jgi:hypothetical protein